VNKLTVFKSTTGWNVRYEEGPELESVLAVMGTNTVPLPFTVMATAETVVLDLQRRLPDADITVEVNGLGIGGSFTKRLKCEIEIAPGMVWNSQRPSWTEVETSTEEENS
jgi:hypothetical protein